MKEKKSGGTDATSFPAAGGRMGSGLAIVKRNNQFSGSDFVEVIADYHGNDSFFSQ